QREIDRTLPARAFGAPVSQDSRKSAPQSPVNWRTPLVAPADCIASSGILAIGGLQMSRFVAQSLAETGTSEDRRRFELTFVDAPRRKQTISVPVGIAPDLAPVLTSLAEGLR